MKKNIHINGGNNIVSGGNIIINGMKYDANAVGGRFRKRIIKYAKPAAMVAKA